MAHDRLTLFQTDAGFTLAFGTRTYFVSKNDPFFNVAQRSLEKNDRVPFYIYMARQEGVGEAFRDELREAIRELKKGDPDQGDDDWRIT